MAGNQRRFRAHSLVANKELNPANNHRVNVKVDLEMKTVLADTLIKAF